MCVLAAEQCYQEVEWRYKCSWNHCSGWCSQHCYS